MTTLIPSEIDGIKFDAPISTGRIEPRPAAAAASPAVAASVAVTAGAPAAAPAMAPAMTAMAAVPAEAAQVSSLTN